MIKDQVVRVKLKKSFHEQRPVSFIGKVVAFSDSWIVVDGKGIMLVRQQSNGVQIDAKSSRNVIPRESVESIRVLPDSFDIGDMSITTEGQQLVIAIDGAADVYIGELGEG